MSTKLRHKIFNKLVGELKTLELESVQLKNEGFLLGEKVLHNKLMKAGYQEEIEEVLVPHMKAIREASKLIINDVATQLDFSAPYISMFENGIRPLPTKVIIYYYELAHKIK